MATARPFVALPTPGRAGTSRQHNRVSGFYYTSDDSVRDGEFSLIAPLRRPAALAYSPATFTVNVAVGRS